MKSVWIIGAGLMAQEYLKVLRVLNINCIIVGRGKETAKQCKEVTGYDVVLGGISSFLVKNPPKPSHVIVAVGIEELYTTTKTLLEYGIKNILVEKPGAIDQCELNELTHLSNQLSSNVFIAYNRRFYASVLKAQKIIEADGGPSSFNFEFTEWGHIVASVDKAEGVKEKWFLGNSTHVVDLAFFLGGKPKKIYSLTTGSLDWHPSSAIFVGAGSTEDGVLFSYQANWKSAGRWSVEILTNEHRLIFRPMEKLQIQKRGSIVQEYDETIDYTLDEQFKPGIYLQTKAFLEEDFTRMCSINEQHEIFSVYNKIANY